MVKFWRIFTHEIVTIVWRRSYWLGVVGIPLLSIMLYGGLNLYNSRQPASDEGGLSLAMLQSPEAMQSMDGISELVNPSEDTSLPLGLVDLAGVTTQVPPELSLNQYRRFASLEEAQQALAAGQVRAFYLFPLDFIRSGQVMYYADNLSFSRALLLDYGLDYWMKYNLLDGADEKISAASQPLGWVYETNLDPAGASRIDIQDTSSLMLMMGIFYFLTILLLGSSGMIFTSFNRESSNRVMEVLMVSTSTHHILWAKFAALSLVGLAQMGLWLAGAALFGVQMGSAFSITALEALTPALFGWSLLFVGLGFLLYGTLMMGVSTIFPMLRETSQVLMVMMMPLMAPMLLVLLFSETPGHPVMVVFSLFPLTAPTTIILRLLMADVPLWQLLLSALLLLLSALGVIRLVARNFRPAHLLTGISYQWFKKFNR